MSFFVLGINHQTASVALREQVAFNHERLATLLAQQSTQLFNDLVVLSTCNRTEIYAITEQSETLLQWLAQHHQISISQLQPHVYVYQDAQAITHLMRVASGLDSLMLGEPQIMGQVKNALQLAKQAQVVSAGLNRIFESAFYAAKRVRSETAVGAHAVSMGYAVAQLALQVFSKAEDLTVLLIAAGEMNRLVAKHFAELGVAKILICNRSAERAQQLAQQLSPRVAVELIGFEHLAQHLHRADVICSCTGSLHTILHYADVKQALKQRRYESMLLVDLAVPRDIDPAVDELDGVYLYGVDDLQGVIDENLAQRRQAAVEAELLVNQLATQFLTQQKVQQAGHCIQQYREQTQQLSQQELQQALQALAHGVPAEAVLQQMAHRLTQKLSHPTSILLREAASHDNSEYFEWLEQHLTDILTHERGHKNDDG